MMETIPGDQVRGGPSLVVRLLQQLRSGGHTFASHVETLLVTACELRVVQPPTHRKR
jgi:hypothetical protein